MIDFICPACGQFGFDQAVCDSCDGRSDETRVSAGEAAQR